MLAKYLGVAVIGSALMAVPAYAQNASSTNSTRQEQTASATGQWQGSKLIHLNVYNEQNDKVGDIKELMLDKSGKIDQVVVGVGGFLGAGEHDVAVKFSDLKFSDQPVRTSSSTNNVPASSGTTGSSAATNTQSAAKRNYPDHAVLNMTKDQLKSMPQFDYNK